MMCYFPGKNQRAANSHWGVKPASKIVLFDRPKSLAVWRQLGQLAKHISSVHLFLSLFDDWMTTGKFSVWVLTFDHNIGTTLHLKGTFGISQAITAVCIALFQ